MSRAKITNALVQVIYTVYLEYTSTGPFTVNHSLLSGILEVESLLLKYGDMGGGYRLCSLTVPEVEIVLSWLVCSVFSKVGAN